MPPHTAALPAEAASALRAARHVVVFTGAGVSAESGIPTFRDALTGLWARFDAMALATPEAFLADPALVWGWYEWRRLAVRQARPNPAHHAIAELARRLDARGARLTLVTQNVDDLHERAGSAAVLHLHGSLHQPRCFDCGDPFLPPGDAAAVADRAAPAGWRPQRLDSDGQRLAPPPCPACGGLIRPGVVWFGESLPADALGSAFDAAEHCDLLISVGTSGVVEPAASIPRVAAQAGAWVLHVNPQSVAPGGRRTVQLSGAAGELLPGLVAQA
ncbi:MAG TPA: NAD-dependent deacylase [Burkholderiaceae bacterium]|nr:NAD-dependent deacylase [Burkholderiaceae bacterium]